MSAEFDIPQGVDLTAVSGPLIVGELLHWGLFGTLTVQIYLYYMAFPRDKPILKAIAYFIYALELVQTILVTNDAFHAYGSGFGNYDELTSMHEYWFSVPIMSGIVALIGQLFFGYRIWVLSSSRVLPALVAVLAFTSSVAGVVTGVCVKEAGKITNLHQLSTKIAVGLWCGLSALCDIFIAACMTYLLSRNADTHIARTKLLVGRLIRLTIETGSVTATVALANLILITVFPDKTYYATFSLIIPKAYANTLLVILNSRLRIVGGRDSDEYSNMLTYASTTGNRRSLLTSPHSHPQGIAVGLQPLGNSNHYPSSGRPGTLYGKPPHDIDGLKSSGDNENTHESRPASAGGRGGPTIRIAIHSDVVSDSAAKDGLETPYSPESARSSIKKEDLDLERCEE
ncbi:hypothetical protein K435DRAFT_734000 [Dendrothele bispora CBS 962.96]|uniref:DUF6534 domain-containing protein n=1 Tax=Dendrothele bispora (strain CBS 962.96) TaxID=1314807 RepID=A0A4S8L4S0_DENBC|nr:hypothetical protein K435DRAFT_734000 [Dendrothele bispora CBS 962.96]